MGLLQNLLDDLVSQVNQKRTISKLEALPTKTCHLKLRYAFPLPFEEIKAVQKKVTFQVWLVEGSSRHFRRALPSFSPFSSFFFFVCVEIN